MLKSFCLKALRLIVLTLLLVQMAFSSAWAQGIQSSQEVTPKSPEMKHKQQEMMPAPSELTTDEGKTTTPSTTMPESALKTPPSKANQPVDPYAKYYDAIKKYNAEVYGKGG